MTRRKSLWFIVTAMCLYLVSWLPSQAQGDDLLNLDRIRRATVYVMQMQTVGDRAVLTCAGSGTIVARSGLIVTNAHNTVANRDCPGDELVIALNTDPDQPPVPTYRAEVAQADPGLDLALLRITHELNGRVIEPGTLALPFVELGDSSQVSLDDTITTVGYPSIGNDPIDVVRGTITGFVAEPSGGERSWFKTDATIPGVMTGGGVYNQTGQLIAVPTTLPVISLSDEATCVVLEDTNDDGSVNRSDICVPVGGFINALRPSTFVRPLLRGASLGISVQKLTSPSAQSSSGGTPTVSAPFIATSVNEGMPTTVVRSLPTGTTSLYLFFDYEDMTPETVYELRVTVDNVPSPRFSLAPVRWSGGQNGLWYIGSTGQVWPNGIYEFTLFVNGIASEPRSVLVGPTEDRPTFRNITFGVEAGENLFGTGYVLPVGNIVNARFVHRNLSEGTPWTAIWYYDGEEISGSRVTENWTGPGTDTKTIRLETPEGLPPGRYRLELYIEDRLAAMSDFTIAGVGEIALPRVFQNIRFTDTPEATEATPISTFPTTTSEIFTVFDWQRIAPGTLWRMRWSVDDVAFYEQTVPWRAAESGENFITRLTAVDTIPDGTYRMDLFIGTILLGSAEAQVGIGQLPIDPFAQTSGVQLNGQIVDAETQAGIPSVTFILISEDFSVSDFTWNQRQIYAMATTDRNGRFQLDRLLEFGSPYSVVVAADGYLPISTDGVVVDEETDNPLNIEIPLTRD